jgi:hypothetical protein
MQPHILPARRDPIDRAAMVADTLGKQHRNFRFREREARQTGAIKGRIGHVTKSSKLAGTARRVIADAGQGD